jgi:hypothetical protein
MTAADPDRIGPLTARHWAWVLALIATASIADDLLRIPVQVRDALEEILAAYRSPSALDSFWTASFNAAYLRPLRIAQIKALFDLGDGNYWLAYRGFHALLLAACVLLFTRALRVRTVTDLVAAAFALAVLTGLHTFRTLIQEAFPINHFLEIAVFALATLNLAQATRRLWTDLAALLVFAAASLTLESGLLIWVVAVSGWMFGLRGISGRGVLLMTGLLGVYLYLRFVSLSVGVPTLDERSSGYLFGVLEPQELQARFGHRLWWFRSYNVIASVLSVLFSEPQSGVFALTRSWLDGQVVARQVIAAVSSLVTTGLIAAVSVGVARRWARPAAGADDAGQAVALLGIGTAVLMASAVLSFAYTKDDIMSTAGVFYALAAYVAVRHVATACAGWRAAKAAAVVALVFLAAATWSVRSLGIHHVASAAAFKTRNDWALQPGAWRREGRWPAGVDEQRLLQRLRDQALSMPAPNPTFDWRWVDRVWGD